MDWYDFALIAQVVLAARKPVCHTRTMLSLFYTFLELPEGLPKASPSEFALDP
jgi:hypothetical protein